MDELEVALKAVRIYAETHPRPTHVNQCQAAEMDHAEVSHIV